MNNTSKFTVLTGDRPTGSLHLGHYVGSILERVRLQDQADTECFVMVADAQAYTDNIDNTLKIRQAIPDIVADYVGCGIDPTRTTIFLQSAVPELAELSQLYMNMTTVSRLERNPTVREEIKHRGFERDIPSGFLCYPVFQAADITGFRATHVPVGEDQLPMIELAQELARKVNRAAGCHILPVPEAVLSKTGRLKGIDGKSKASKSLGNAIHLNDTDIQIEKKVMGMFTDPNHLHVKDPGQVEGNAVFGYLDVFHQNKQEVEGLKIHYMRGGLGDVKVKRILLKTLLELIGPIRDRREVIVSDPSLVNAILLEGTQKARKRVSQVLADVKVALGVYTL